MSSHEEVFSFKGDDPLKPFDPSGHTRFFCLWERADACSDRLIFDPREKQMMDRTMYQAPLVDGRLLLSMNALAG